MPSQGYIKDDIPTIEDSTITLHVKSEAEAASLNKKKEPIFNNYCESVGLRNYNLALNVKTEMKDLEDFRKHTVAEDKELVKNAVKLQQEREKQQANAPMHNT